MALTGKKILVLCSKTKDKDFKLFKIQVDDIILPWVADGVLCIGGFLCLNMSPFLAILYNSPFF